jgi:hypothetical protein
MNGMTCYHLYKKGEKSVYFGGFKLMASSLLVRGLYHLSHDSTLGKNILLAISLKEKQAISNSERWSRHWAIKT